MSKNEVLLEEKIYIIEESRFLKPSNYANLRDIALNDNKTCVKEYPDGIRIILDDLTNDSVMQMYNYITNQLKYK